MDGEVTTAVYGYGLPTMGAYMTDVRGYKTFGSTGQGNYSEGVLDTGDSLDSQREIIVTVAALANQGASTIILETSCNEFIVPPGSRGAAAQLSVSVLIALISMLMLSG